MASRRTNIATLLLILLGVIIIPVLFIWSADNIFVLTVKTFIAVLFLLLLLRSIPRKKSEPHSRDTGETGEEG